jgi:hypothetical protein
MEQISVGNSDRIYQKTGTQKTYATCEEDAYWEDFPSIQLVLGGKTFTWQPEEYVIWDKYEGNNGACFIAI